MFLTAAYRAGQGSIPAVWRLPTDGPHQEISQAQNASFGRLGLRRGPTASFIRSILHPKHSSSEAFFI